MHVGPWARARCALWLVRLCLFFFRGAKSCLHEEFSIPTSCLLYICELTAYKKAGVGRECDVERMHEGKQTFGRKEGERLADVGK